MLTPTRRPPSAAVGAPPRAWLRAAATAAVLLAAVVAWAPRPSTLLAPASDGGARVRGLWGETIDNNTDSGTGTAPDDAPPARPPVLWLVCRAYAGERPAYDAIFQPASDAFVLLGPSTRLVMVLDDESAVDHEWGDELLAAAAAAGAARFVTVAYAPPNPAVHEFKPFKVLQLKKYSSDGYNRMIYDTFFLDTWLPPEASPWDLLGVVDSDMGIAAPLLPALFLADDAQAAAVNRSGVGQVDMPITWGGLRGDGKTGPGLTVRRRRLRVATVLPTEAFFPGGAALMREAMPWDIMSVDSMPIVFWVRTFAHTRAVAAARSPEGTFLSAWLDVGRRITDPAMAPISPVNVLFSFGVMYEPEAYAPAMPQAGVADPEYHGWLPGNPPGGPVVPAVGSNRLPPFLARLGCCVALGVPGCNATQVRVDWDLTVTFVPHWQHGLLPSRAAGEAAYELIDTLVDSLPGAELLRCQSACAAYADAYEARFAVARKMAAAATGR